MSNIFVKKLFSDTVLFGSLNSFNKFFNFFLFFLFVKYLNKENIAIFDTLFVFYSFILLLVSFQLESSFARFYFNEHKHNQHFDLLKTISLLNIIFGFVYFLPLIFIFKALFQNLELPYINFVIIFIIINAVQANISNLINIHFRFIYNRKSFVISNLLFPLFYTFFCCFFIFLDSLDYTSLFFSLFIGRLVSLLFQLYTIKYELLQSRFKYYYLKDIFKYSLPMLPMLFCIYANDKLFVFILREFVELNILADFSLSCKFVVFLTTIFVALRFALEPKINHFISFPSYQAINLYKKYINTFFCVSFFFFILYFIFVPFVNEFFFFEYKNAFKWSLPLVITLILFHLGGYINPGFNITKRMDLKLYIVAFQAFFSVSGFYLILKNNYSVLFALKYIVFISFIFLLVQHYVSNKLHKVSSEYFKILLIFTLVFII